MESTHLFYTFSFNLLQDVDPVTDEDLNPTRDKFPTLESERKTLRNPDCSVEATMLDRQNKITDLENWGTFPRLVKIFCLLQMISANVLPKEESDEETGLLPKIDDDEGKPLHLVGKV